MTDTNKNIILEPDVRIYKSTSDDNNLLLAKSEVNQLISDYAQPKLTAGDNITINDSTISATDTTYSAGTGISIVDGVISNTQSSAIWGNITGTIGNQADLSNEFDSVYAEIDTKQDILTFDSTPIESSNNPVTSSGVYTALAAKENLGKITISGTEYTVAISSTDAGQAGYITFVVESSDEQDL